MPPQKIAEIPIGVKVPTVPSGVFSAWRQWCTNSHESASMNRTSRAESLPEVSTMVPYYLYALSIYHICYGICRFSVTLYTSCRASYWLTYIIMFIDLLDARQSYYSCATLVLSSTSFNQWRRVRFAFIFFRKGFLGKECVCCPSRWDRKSVV